jgi:parallel beta-helix repeat protein
MGISLGFKSNNNTIFENQLHKNKEAMIIANSSYNIINKNIITECEGAIGISFSLNNEITENKLTNNEYSISIISDSELNNISKNEIENSEVAIGFIDRSENNQITKNKIVSNEYGIYLNLSSNNMIYMNNFVNNTYQTNSVNSFNQWNSEVLAIGNYWSDYEEKYPEAEKIEGQKIWNIPYDIDSNNKDDYPSVNPQE